MTEFDINACYSPLTEYSRKYVSLHEIEGKQSACSYEIELIGEGFICTAVIMIGLLGSKFYKPCHINNGQCPIDQYRQSFLPDS